jgi:predicted ArsR family transcriptional regulator
MSDGQAVGDTIEAVALLGDRHRRELYRLVAASPEPIGRDEAAASLGISRELAAFHLDRLVAGGLLETEYRRRSGRSGPGAGRPAKLYRRTEREIAVSLPHRNYVAAAGVFADALDRLDPRSVAPAVSEVAHREGVGVGVEARPRTAGPRPGRRRLKAALVERLAGAGFEPQTDPSSGDVSLRNCPYAALSSSHRDLTCGMNLAWAQGIVDGLGDQIIRVELAPAPGRCCVVFREGRVATTPVPVTGG